MFDRERWIEIFAVIFSNPLRSALTALGVFWGILMLIVLLGAGNGLGNGANQQFGDWATNSMFMWPMVTTKPYAGLSEGRQMLFTNEDTEAIDAIEGTELVCPRIQLGGWRDGNNVTRGTKSGGFSIYGEHPRFLDIQAKEILAGRWLSPLDLSEQRKTCVIGRKVQQMLFEEGEDPLGEYISIQGVNFKVVGVFDAAATSDWSARMAEAVSIPITTFQRAFNWGNKVGFYGILVEEGYEVSAVQASILESIKKRKKVHPEDDRAFGAHSIQEEAEKMDMVLTAIHGIGWFVGVLTLFAGIIGVSNIMLVVVKERTKEIGVRRALGATPGNIILQIQLESVFLTSIAGYMGMITGMLLLNFFGPYLEAEFFSNPEVDLSTALTALVILIVAGLLAGLIPAMRAVQINPVDALRAE